MDILELKIITFGYITSKPHLTIQEKKNLLLFVKEASESQLIYFIKEGRMYSKNEVVLKEQGKSDFTKDVERLKGATNAAIKGGTKGLKQWGAETGEPLAAGEREKLVQQGLERAKQRDAAKNPITSKTKEVASDIKKGAEKAVETGKEYVAKGTELAKKGAEQAVEKGKEVGSQLQQTGQQAAQWAQQNPGSAAAIAALSAGAITAGVLAYKRFFSKAAKACTGLSGAQKTQCMGKYKIQAKKAEIATLNSKKSSCKGNPKCIAKIQARIQKASAEAKAMAAGG